MHFIEQLVQTLPMRGRDGDDVGEAVAREVRPHGVLVDAVDLVDDQQGRPRQLAQPGQDLVIQRRGAFAAIDHEQHQVGFAGGGTRLARGGAGQAFLVTGDAAGVDHDEGRLPFQPAHAIVAVPGHAGLVMDQRVATARQRVE